MPEERSPNASDAMPGPRVWVATAAAPGAVALLQLRGPGAVRLLRELTGVADWPAGMLRLARFGDIDEGLAVLLREEAPGGGTAGRAEAGAWAQLMPHGGPRVVQKLLERLRELGAAWDADPPPRALYPEAASDLEADMLAALARAASPAAIDLLLAQPATWREFVGARAQGPGPSGEVQERRAKGQGKEASDDTSAGLPPGPWALDAGPYPLDHLLEPPLVVVVGRPNVGKSTLANRVLGRAASLVADLPGTTRDWVAGLAELRVGPSLVAVRWIDTPGLRRSDDPVEQRAIELARPVIASADVLIAMRDASSPWPAPAELGRAPDLRVVNKIDLGPAPSEDAVHPPPLGISAATGAGVGQLEAAVLAALGLDEALLMRPQPWAFSPRLRELLEREDWEALAAYVGGISNDEIRRTIGSTE